MAGPPLALWVMGGLLVLTLFLATLSRAVDRCRPPVLVLRLASTLRAEHRARGLAGGGDFGRTLGLAWAVSGLAVVSVLCSFVLIDPVPNPFHPGWVVVGVARFGLFVGYWVRVAALSRPLAVPAGPLLPVPEDADDVFP